MSNANFSLNLCLTFQNGQETKKQSNTTSLAKKTVTITKFYLKTTLKFTYLQALKSS